MDIFKISIDWDCWQCPDCGWDTSEDEMKENLKKITTPRLNYAVSMEFGGHPVDWTETWECPECGCIFNVNNDNY